MAYARVMERPDGTKPEITLYVDGECPFCTAETDGLCAADTAGVIELVDISGADFDAAAHGLDAEAVQRRLHARTRDGTLLLDLDPSRVAWRLVGRPEMVRWTEWPVVRSLLDHVAYPLFARIRVPLGRWLVRRRR